MSTSEIQEKYVTNVRLDRKVTELREALEQRGVTVPSGSNPKSLLV